MVTLLMLWRWALRTVYVFWEKCSLYLYQKRLTIWLACNAGNRIRRGCGKNRWKVEIADFTDAYLFFMRLAKILNSEIEAHNGIEQVFYTCKLPGTSGTKQHFRYHKNASECVSRVENQNKFYSETTQGE